MRTPIETVKGRIVDVKENGDVTIVAHYDDWNTLTRRGYRDVYVEFIDSRPLSDKQRRGCYAMIGEIADWMGESRSEAKELLKVEFWTSELWQTTDRLFSLSNAPVSVVAAFQRWLARFMVSHDIPSKKSLLSYVDDISDYIYSCLINKKCCICGKGADLHHVDRIGMGRDRTDVIHEGMEALPLCREHHTQAHGMPDAEFFKLYHIDGGINLDKTLCKIYGLKARK